jgi:hypothetical protein
VLNEVAQLDLIGFIEASNIETAHRIEDLISSGDEIDSVGGASGGGVFDKNS